MFFDERNPDKYYVSAGTLDGKISLPKAHHVLLGQRHLGMILMII